jgi:hypothetical protein
MGRGPARDWQGKGMGDRQDTTQCTYKKHNKRQIREIRDSLFHLTIVLEEMKVRKSWSKQKR